MLRCPKCERGNTLKIRLYTSYGLYAVADVQKKKMFPKTSKMYAYACTKCGHIFDLTLENPEVLAPFVTLE